MTDEMDDTALQVEAAIRDERARIVAELRTLDTRWVCGQCAAHNEHDECERPTPADYAAAIAGEYRINNGRWERRR